MMRFADIGVSVTDAKASAKWWVEKVGFRTTHIPGNDHAILVAPPGDRYLLHLCESYEPVSAGNTGIAFLTDDLDRDVGRMEAAGVKFEPRATSGHEVGMAKFHDPDGNVFWLIGAPAPMIQQLTGLQAEP